MAPHRTPARLRTAFAGLVLSLAVAACGGGGSGDDAASSDEASATTAEAPPAPSRSDEATATSPAPPTTDVAATTAPPTSEAPATTAAPTTVPAIQPLTVSLLSEQPDLGITNLFTADGLTAIGLAERPSPEGRGSTSLVRLDANGAITQEAPIGESLNAFNVITSGSGRRFLYLSDWSADVSCQLREIDPAGLALGWPIAVSSNGSCGGMSQPDPDHADVIWLGPLGDTLAKVDVATSGVTPISIAAAIPAGYEAWGDATILDGNAFVMVEPGFDTVTGEQVTAPDGSALPPMLIKVDGASGTASPAVAVPGGFLTVADGRLLLHDRDRDAWQQIDPATLTLSDATGEPTRPPTGMYAGDGVAWSIDQTGGGTFDVAQRDPDTARQVAVGAASVAASDDEFVSVDAVSLGKDLLVVARKERYADNSFALTTTLFKATAG